MGYYAVERCGYSLTHHGILGMKWGIRRFQNQDGSLTAAGRERYGVRVSSKRLNKLSSKGVRAKELTEAHTIPVGTKIYRTTATETESSSGLKYISYADVDRHHYRGGWIRANGNTGKAYEHTYELSKDLNVPSRKETFEVVNSVIDSDPKMVTKTVNAWLDVAMPKGSDDRYYACVDPLTDEYNPKNWDGFVKDAVKQFNEKDKDAKAFYAMQSLGLNPDLREKVVSNLKDRGYNAMTDEASVGGQGGWGREGIDPIIVFDGSILNETSSVEISKGDEMDSMRQYLKTKKGWDAKKSKIKSW